MANLIYSGIISLDGYIADETGNFEWAMPSKEVHTFINDLERPVGTYLFGRKMYEVMAVWETMHTFPKQPSFVLEYAKIWKSADKTVFSKTLETVSSSRTTIERNFDPEAVRNLKMKSSRDLGIGGPGLAAYAIRAGLVDEYHLFITPVLVGGGKPFFPHNVRLKLKLMDECRFDNGMVHFHYRAFNQGE